MYDSCNFSEGLQFFKKRFRMLYCKFLTHVHKRVLERHATMTVTGPGEEERGMRTDVMVYFFKKKNSERKKNVRKNRSNFPLYGTLNPSSLPSLFWAISTNNGDRRWTLFSCGGRDSGPVWSIFLPIVRVWFKSLRCLLYIILLD